MSETIATVGRSTNPTFPNALREPPLIFGRDAELDRIMGIWDAASAGSRQALFVEAGAGVGKSSLTANAAVKVAERGGEVLLGNAHDGSRLSFEPFTLAFEDWAGRVELDVLVEALGEGGPGLKRIVPALKRRMPDLPDPIAGDRVGLRLRVFSAFEKLLGGICDRSPVLLILEDLHWADGDSVSLLEHLIGASERWPLMLAATYRPAEIPDGLGSLRATLAGRPDVHGLELEECSQEVTARIIESLTGVRPSDAVLAEVHSVAGGNAFWVDELARGLLAQPDGAAALGAESAPEALPETLTETIRHRLELVDEETRRVLADASALGRELDPALLVEVIGLPAEKVEATLAVAAKENLVTPGGAFAHPLIEEVLYEGLNPIRRRRLHRRIGGALLERYGEEVAEHASQLALHFLRAGEGYRDQAFGFSAVAAQNAIGVSAYGAAIQHIEDALRLQEEQEPGPERDAMQFRLLVGKGIAVMSRDGIAAPQTVEVFERVDAIAGRLPRTPELLPGLHGAWAVHGQAANFERSGNYAEMQLAIGEQLPIGGDRLRGSLSRLVDLTFVGNLAEASEWGERCLAMIDDPDFAPERFDYGGNYDAVGLTICVTAWLAHVTGRISESLELARRAESVIESKPEAEGLAAIVGLGALYVWRRESAAAAEWGSRSIEICERLQIAQWFVEAQILQGWATARSGSREGAELARAGCDGWFASGSNLGACSKSVLAAEALLLVGELDAGLEVIERGLGIGKRTGEHWFRPSALRLRAELLGARDAADPRVGPLYQQAIELAREQGARTLELQASLPYAHWAGVESDQAQRALAAALEGFDPADQMPDLEEARGLLLATAASA